MAVMKPSEIAEEERHEVIAESFLCDVPSFPGLKCVRDITPLVMTALQRANNPYVTGKKGFEAAGIEMAVADSRESQIAFAMAMMPKTAEVLVLLTCSRDDLKKYCRGSVPSGSSLLEDAALDLVDSSTMESMAAATLFISGRLQAITLSRVSPSSEDDKPVASTLEDTGPKEPAPTG